VFDPPEVGKKNKKSDPPMNKRKKGLAKRAPL
jgi:hypothetical protein